MRNSVYTTQAYVYATYCTVHLKNRLITQGRLPMKYLAETAQIATIARLVDIFSVAGDLAITITFVYVLRRSLEEHELKGSRSERIANRIILFAMGSGLITTLCAIMALITVRSPKHDINYD